MRFSVLAEFLGGFAVLDDFFSSVLRFLIYPNAPLIKLAMKFIPDLLTLTVCHCETHGLGCQLMDSQFQSNPRPAEKSVPSST